MATPGSSNLAANFGTAIPADPFAWATAFPTTTIPTPTPSTYTLTPSAASANEGTTLSFAIATTGVTAGTDLYWSLSGTGITTADFTSVTSLLGSSVVQPNGSASINLNINADLLKEGNEGLSVQLYSDLNRSQLVASSTVTLNDTSTTPAPVTGQTYWGTTSTDTITGSGGNDRIAGVTATGTRAANLGRGQIDVLTGGLGADTFLLGDARGVFYDDGSAGNLGNADYARITDFTSGVDKLQLRNGNYFTTVSNGVTSLYWDRNTNGVLNTTGTNRDELIAMIQGTFTTADVVWA
jgi:hypothetical protein